MDWRGRVPETARAVAQGALAATLAAGRRRRRAAGRRPAARPRRGRQRAVPAARRRLRRACSTPCWSRRSPRTPCCSSGSYLLGPGFAVGTGTLVSPAAVVLGPVPAFPLLAALPADGPAPALDGALVALPGAGRARSPRCWCVRRFPAYGFEAGAVRGLGSGVARRRAAHRAGRRWPAAPSGPAGWPTSAPTCVPTFVAATVALGVGGLVGGVGRHLVARRRCPAAVGSLSGVSRPLRSPARLVVLVSGAGTNLQALLDACRRPGVRRPRWSPSAPTATASRAWPAPSAPASRPSCTGSRTSPAATDWDARADRRPCAAYEPDLVVLGRLHEAGRRRRSSAAFGGRVRQHPPGAARRRSPGCTGPPTRWRTA